MWSGVGSLCSTSKVDCGVGPTQSYPSVPPLLPPGAARTRFTSLVLAGARGQFLCACSASSVYLLGVGEAAWQITDARLRPVFECGCSDFPVPIPGTDEIVIGSGVLHDWDAQCPLTTVEVYRISPAPALEPVLQFWSSFSLKRPQYIHVAPLYLLAVSYLGLAVFDPRTWKEVRFTRRTGTDGVTPVPLCSLGQLIFLRTR